VSAAAAPVDLIAALPAARTLTAADLDGLVEELAAYHAHFAPLFRHPAQRAWAAVYLRGLLTADVPRKNVEALALRLLGAGAGADNRVRAMQQFVGAGGWDDAGLLAAHQRLVDETLGADDGVLLVDGHETPKQGTHSVGVARQWCGHSGKQDNCQAGVYLGYASRRGYTLLDRRLYLPAAWFTAAYADRRWACRIPRGTSFRTKHALAGDLVEAAVAAGTLRARWVLADEGYGDSPALLDRWGATGLWYLAEVARDRPAGCPPAPPRAKGQRQPKRGCTRPVPLRSGSMRGRRRPLPRAGSTTGCWRGARGRCSRRSSRCGSSWCASACPARRAGCWCVAACRPATRSRRTNTTSATPPPTWRWASSSASAGCAGRSRPASRRGDRSWGWTTTRPAPGGGGTTTRPSSSSRTTSWSGCNGGSTRERGACQPPPAPLSPGAHTPTQWAWLLPPAPVGLSVTEVRVLLRALLPLPAFDPAAALAWLAYQQRRKLAAYRAHRRRRLRRRAGDSS